MNDIYKYFLRREPLSHRDASFINVIYFIPVGMLLETDRVLICECLTKARLVCQWLEGILKLIDKLDATNANKKGN